MTSHLNNRRCVAQSDMRRSSGRSTGDRIRRLNCVGGESVLPQSVGLDNFLSEDVSGVDLARYVFNGGRAVGADLVDLGFTEINVLYAFVGKGRCSQNHSGIVM